MKVQETQKLGDWIGFKIWKHFMTQNNSNNDKKDEIFVS